MEFRIKVNMKSWVRPDEGLQQKSAYVRQNPVRAGLVRAAEDWPHFVDHAAIEGR